MRFDEALPNVINTTNARPYPRPTHTVSHRGRNSASGHNACHKFPKDLCAANGWMASNGAMTGRRDPAASHTTGGDATIVFLAATNC